MVENVSCAVTSSLSLVVPLAALVEVERLNAIVGDTEAFRVLNRWDSPLERSGRNNIWMVIGRSGGRLIN